MKARKKTRCACTGDSRTRFQPAYLANGSGKKWLGDLRESLPVLRRGQRRPRFAQRLCPPAKWIHRAVARRVFEYSIDRQRVPARRSSRAHAAIETRHIPVNNTMTILRNKGTFLMVGSRIHAANCIATMPTPVDQKKSPETRHGRAWRLFVL